MAQIDVTELFTDPDFTDPMVVITRVPSVDYLGQNSIIESALQTVGSIQPASGHALNRIPEALRSADMKNFWFKGEIIATAPGKYTSILVFKGRRYQVKNVFDWTNWGQGWSEGLCVGELPA